MKVVKNVKIVKQTLGFRKPMVFFTISTSFTAFMSSI